MKKVFKIFSISFGVLVCLLGIIIVIAITSDNGKILLPVKHKKVFEITSIKNLPLKLQVRENKIIDENEEIIILKGIMPQDPAQLHNRNKFNKEILKEIREIGSNAVRIPVHPENWYNDKDYLWRYLDKIVTWAGELDMYVIVDWHYIGNVSSGRIENNHIDEVKPKQLTKEFWKQTANYFKDTPHVIFEIFNEPAFISEEDWFTNATEIVNIIREQGADQILIVGGIEFSKDLSWVLEKPIESKNIAYASHIYPGHRGESSWDRWFGDVSEKYPVIVTEWGFMDENRDKTKQSFLKGDEESYGEPFTKYLKEKNIGWIACWYDDTWEPQMFNKDFKDYTNYGKFVLELLKQ